LDAATATVGSLSVGSEAVGIGSDTAAITEAVLTATGTALAGVALVLVTPENVGEGSDVIPGVYLANDAAREREDIQKAITAQKEAIRKCKKEAERCKDPEERKKKLKECRQLIKALERTAEEAEEVDKATYRWKTGTESREVSVIAR
jgi:hypothetical protein